MKGVYFLTDEHGRVKIGRCETQARIKAVSKKCGAALTLARFIARDDNWLVETWLHEKFRSDRLPGTYTSGDREWYRFRVEMLEIQPPTKAEMESLIDRFGWISENIRKGFAETFSEEIQSI